MTPSLQKPPRIASIVLSWLLSDDWETPSGDFEEYYNQLVQSDGTRTANSWYRKQVLMLFPGRIVSKFAWSMLTFLSNVKVTLRGFKRHKGYASINIGGLSIGLAACILIVLFIHDELSFDRFHANSDRIVRILESRLSPDGGAQHFARSFAPLGQAMKDDLPDVDEFVIALTSWNVGRQTVQYADNRYYESDYIYTDPAFFQLFDFEWLAGNPVDALAGPSRAVLTESASLKYFGEIDPLGQSFSIERDGDFTVVGLIKDPPLNSHLDFSMVLSLDTYRSNERLATFLQDWESFDVLTYLLLSKNASLETVKSGMELILERNLEQTVLKSRIPYLQRLSDIHFGSSHVDFDQNRGRADISTIYMFAAIAFFILLIASINYTNMATARSFQRAKEIGLRKAVGAHRSQLARQFLSESIVTTVSALVIGLVIARLALPFFNQVIGKSLTFAVLGNPVFIGGLVLLLVLVGLLSGSYPALVLSRFQPAIVLKGQATLRSGSNRLRQALVVAQFTLSIGLIIASLIVAKQLDFIQKRALGFNQDQLVVVDINDGNSRANFVAMKNDLSSSASVQSVSVSSNVPGDWKNITQIEIFAPDIDSEQIITSHFLAVDGDFLDTFEIGLREGRNITDTSPSDSLSVLVNASAAQQLGLRIGDRLAVKSGSLSRRFRDGRFEPMVVGIVENFHFESLYEEIGPIVLGYYLNPIDVIDYFTIRIDGQNVSSTLEHLRTVGQKYDPRHPFEYNFLDDRIADFYDAEAKLGRIFNLATVLAVLIACLGLLGLTAIMTTQRTKEIGLRKALGASVQNIIILLSKEILLLVIVSFVLALPPSYLLMSKWLEGFAYRTHLGVELSLITLLLAIFVAVLTVSYQTLRAATADPVKSLRYE